MSKGSSYTDTGPPWYRSVRYLIALVAFFCFVNIFLQRVGLTLAIVCMVNHTAVDLLSREAAQVENKYLVLYNETLLNNSVTRFHDFVVPDMEVAFNQVSNHSNRSQQGQHSCSPKEGATVEHEDGDLVWTKETQGIVLGGLYWGYMGLQIPGVFVIRRFGPARVVAASMILMSVLTLLTPVTAWWSPWALVGLRAVIGVFHGLAVPGIFAIWTKWAPPAERARLVGMSFAGNMIGTALTFPLSAVLCKSVVAGGWPAIFYLYGTVGVVCGVVWTLYVCDEPARHPRIHPGELTYLRETVTVKHSIRERKTPWLKILTSLPYLSIICAQFTYNWGLFLFMSTLPLYMREVMRFDIKSNGSFSFIPYLVMFTSIMLSTSLADALISRKLLSIVLTRKLMTFIGHFVPAVLLVVLSYLDCTQRAPAVALLSLSMFCGGFAFAGILVNFYDIAPAFAGPMMTVSNTFSAIPGILAPYAVAEITKDRTREQWQVVFFLTAGLLSLGTLAHLVFGSGHVQAWAVTSDERAVEEQDTLS